MSRIRRPALLTLGAAGLLLLAACNAFQDRAEFAPPQSRWPASTARADVNAPPPPVPAQYCYRTLATVDCFAQPKPDRVTGYTGTYPEPNAIDPPAPAAK